MKNIHPIIHLKHLVSFQTKEQARTQGGLHLVHVHPPPPPFKLRKELEQALRT